MLGGNRREMFAVDDHLIIGVRRKQPEREKDRVGAEDGCRE